MQWHTSRNASFSAIVSCVAGGGELGVAPKSVERVKDRIRQITRRNRGIEIEEMVGELNSFLTGWVAYFRFAKCKSLIRELVGGFVGSCSLRCV